MIKKILLFIVLFGFISNAQNTVSGELHPSKDYSWVILYQLKNSKQVYIANSTIVEGKFSIEIPKNTERGVFRLVYHMDEGGNVDFIYDQQDISIVFDPKNTLNTLHFKNSGQNEVYRKYIQKMTRLQFVADSLQLAYFKEKERETSKLYEKNVRDISKLQSEFEKKSEEMPIANHLIKANTKFYSKKTVDTPQEYLNNIKNHFFDAIDFSNPTLQNSTVISEKIINYVFELSSSEDVEVQNKLYKKSTQEVLKKVKNDTLQQKNIIELLLFNFVALQNVSSVDFLIKKYEELPQNLQDNDFLNEVNDKMRLAIGKPAPNFSWGKDKKTDLYQQPNTQNYLIAFWSSTCSHCLDEIPKLYDYTKDKKNLKVIAIALENDELGFNYYTENYTKWVNILSLNKWENGVAQKYKITETPSYFILDGNKKIIAKPEFLKDVKEFLEPSF